MARKFTYSEHIKKHTMRENTYNQNCEFCNPELKLTEVQKKLRERFRY